MKTQQTETEVVAGCIQLLNIRGYYAQRINSGRIFKQYSNKNGQNRGYSIKLADEGSPDIFACIRGRFVGIECKRDAAEVLKWNENPNEHDKMQHFQHTLIEKAGGIAITISSVEILDSCIRYIEKKDDANNKLQSQQAKA